jgi:hypothetical protein
MTSEIAASQTLQVADLRKEYPTPGERWWCCAGSRWR